MATGPRFTKIKDGFYLVEWPEIRDSSWYLTRRHGQGTFAEIAKDAETGVFIAPWPFNQRIAVETHTDPELRRLWDGASLSEVVAMAYQEIIRQLAEEAGG
jgi:hypothetical protein